MNNNTEDFIDSKIESIIKENNIYHVGKVIRINSFIIEATGLEDAFFFEKVYVGDENNIGYVDKIEENKVFIALVKTNGNIKIGDSIKTTGEALEASFSKNAMGMIVDAFGVDRMTGKSFNESKMIPIETPKIPIMDRTAVNRPLETGIASIDLMFPIGRGQRQLIIGDKKTGKTQILLDTIINQRGKNVICIYVSIGKTKKEVKRLYSKLVEKGANAYTQIVAVFNDDTSPLIKLTPYVGLSIAEEYMREGYDVLVCIDDLKKHADSCREIALISEKNTGREAYPSDIFYTHSRLLEKGCQYKNGGSITILPVVETKGGDITDYISTNIISITDGQIVLSEKNFKKGQKPALDFGLSVSRLGGAVQKDSIKKIGAAVRRELLTYLETADVYQLVKIDAMSKELQEKVYRGRKLLELLNQPKFSPRSEEKLISNFEFILEDGTIGKADPNSELLDTKDDNNDSNDDNNINNGGQAVEVVTDNTDVNVVTNVEVPVQTEVVVEPTSEVVVETPVEAVPAPVEEEVWTPEVVPTEVQTPVEVTEEVATENVEAPVVEVSPIAPVAEEAWTPEVVPTEVQTPVEVTEEVATENVEAPVVEDEQTPLENIYEVQMEDIVPEVVQPEEVEEHVAELVPNTPEVETLLTTEIPVEKIKEALNDDIETLKTTEIPVEAIKQVLNEDIETLKTTEIPVEAIKQVLNEDVETLYTTEVPIIKSVEPYEDEEENSVPVIEESYTVEIPKLGLEQVVNDTVANENIAPEITYIYPDANNPTDNNGVN
jgi:F-type H+-transporting ATPase subunit alpha